jgi:predicted DCC family thiol-disulfide oxidoreductase YuxK
MQSGLCVVTPPLKPLMVYDGNCNFCTLWIRRWQLLTDGKVDFLPAQDPKISAQFPEIPREQFNTAVQLIETDGTVYSGAHAVFRTLAHHPKRQGLLRTYEHSAAFADITEWAYRLVAGNRTFFSWLTRWFWGRHLEPPTYFLPRWMFLRALGVIYLIAFVSLWTQIDGLIGHNGILPANRFMSAVGQQCDLERIGLDRFHLVPTLCWFNASDGFLHFQCAVGVALAIFLVMGIVPIPCLALLWLLYLSLATVGRDFLGFQWDNLLLEAGFLAIFFAPWQFWPWRRVGRAFQPAGTGGFPDAGLTGQECPVNPQTGMSAPRRSWQWCESPPSLIALWLLRLLLFKLMFSSGCVKLASGDPNWRNLKALTLHYQTQPLPTWIGWYASQLPLWFQKFSCAMMFGAELGAPFLIFAPRRLRFCGAGAIACLQVLILLTGNYTFFNLLTLALCLLLLDDFALARLIPRNLFRRRGAGTPGTVPARADDVTKTPETVLGAPNSRLSWPKFVTLPLAIVVGLLYLFQVSLTLGVRPVWFYPVAVADLWLSPFRTFNGYGLFAVMTTDRREIVVEGSDDGLNWRPYEFKYKPGDVTRRPGFVAPFQPRLDWQMWFAALGDYRQNPWFVYFCSRLLQGSPEVLALLEKNPFPNHPPQYVRAVFYDYQFTNFTERHKTGAWWKRELLGPYLPSCSLSDFQKLP